MKVSTIDIKRFRSIQSLNLKIDLSNNFVTICGANNTGKTNVLKALNLFFNPNCYIVAEDSPNHKYYGSRGGKAFPEITLTFDDANTTYEVVRKFGLNDLEETNGLKKVGKVKTILNTEEIEQILNKFVFVLIPAINISFPELINDLIDDVYDIEYSRTKFSGLKKKLKTAFDEYTHGLVDVLNELAGEINPEFQQFNPDWSVGFGYSSDDIKFRDLISEDFEFYLNDKSNRNIQGKGSGLQRLGFILLHSRIIQKSPKKTVLFCIDEPDVYLHQGLQKKLKSYLAGLSKACQIIITSHSPVFIDSYKLNNVFLLELKIEDEVFYKRTSKSFYPLSTELVNLSDENGLKLIREYIGIESDDYEILDGYNIIVEGESDKKYIEETCRFFDIKFCNIISSNGATKIEKYLEFYDSFYKERPFKPSIRIIIDNDETGREQYKKIHKKVKDQVFNNIKVSIEFVPTCEGKVPTDKDILNNIVASNYEIEDFIYPDLLIHNANELLKAKKFTTIKKTDIEKKIKSKSLNEKGILFNIDLVKSEKNPDNGHLISFNSEQAKNGIAKLYNLQANLKIAELTLSMDKKYPFVKECLTKWMDYNNFTPLNHVTDGKAED